MTDGKDAERDRLMRQAVRLAISHIAREIRLAQTQSQPITARNVRRLLQRNLGTAISQPIRETEVPLIVQLAIRS